MAALQVFSLGAAYFTVRCIRVNTAQGFSCFGGFGTQTKGLGQLVCISLLKVIASFTTVIASKNLSFAQ
jgi:CRISPR/Cas system CMR-associated protein Cmr1 (group 7 of RAMP superfamily)